ncbi:MAG: hypothetical protein M5U28_25260, partial [Sandaracinaceae bacterium]|nr:hypothetical protein [Sandaracinaceae bacterium]
RDGSRRDARGRLHAGLGRLLQATSAPATCAASSTSRRRPATATRQTMFKLADGERIVKMIGFDPRVLEVPEAAEGAEPEPPFAIAVSRGGMVTRFSLRQLRDPSTRSGRRHAPRHAERAADEVLMVDLSPGDRKLACATRKAHALLTTDDEVPVLGGPGKGVKLIKLGKGDEVIGARVMGDSTAPLVLENEKGKRFEITVWRTVTARGGKGQPLFKRGELVREVPPEPTVPELSTQE